MKALGIALIIVGYALFYTGASNLFTGGQGWGFLQALLNAGTANQAGSVPNTLGGTPKQGGKADRNPGTGKKPKGSTGLGTLLDGLSRLGGSIL